MKSIIFITRRFSYLVLSFVLVSESYIKVQISFYTNSTKMPLQTTVIGAWPKPDYLVLPDWFKSKLPTTGEINQGKYIVAMFIIISYSLVIELV